MSTNKIGRAAREFSKVVGFDMPRTDDYLAWRALAVEFKFPGWESGWPDGLPELDDIYAHVLGATRAAAVANSKVEQSEAADDPTPKKRAKATINARMLEVIQRDVSAMGWSSTRWGQELLCSRSAIVGTETWKTSEMAREKNRAERTRDRRQKRQHHSRSD